MGSPTPPPAGAVWILQSDLDSDAAAINTAVTALQAVLASGTLNAANEDALNAAIGGLTGLTTVPVTPTP